MSSSDEGTNPALSHEVFSGETIRFGDDFNDSLGSDDTRLVPCSHISEDVLGELH